MANIKVEINLFPNASNGYIDYDSSNFGELNNISDYKELNKVSFNSRSYILGKSGALGLNINYFYSNKYKGIMSRVKSNQNGEFQVPYQIILRGENLSFIRINFDTLINEYARELRIDGVLIENSELVIVHELETPKNEILIEILKWSKSNSQVVINAITMDIQEVLTKNQIQDLLIGNQLTNDNEKPSYSVIGQYGNFNLLDKNYTFYNYIKNDIITNDTSVKVYFNNQIIATFTETVWKKNSDNSSYYIELKDGTTLFGTTLVPIEVFHYVDIQPVSMLKIFDDVFQYTNLDTYKMSNKVRDKFERIILNKVFMKRDDDLSLLAIYNKICIATQTIIFINSSNELEVVEYV